MGCDIHIAVEQYHTEEGKWHRVLPPESLIQARLDANPGLRREVEYYQKNPGEVVARYYLGRYTRVWYDIRCYPLFAALANVRNDYGITPIDRPRGLPSDLSDEVGYLINGHDPSYNDIWMGEHSFSHLYAEGVAGLWDQVVNRPGAGHVIHNDWFLALDCLKELAGDFPEYVRIVIGFDS
jgi:hypothetical protein